MNEGARPDRADDADLSPEVLADLHAGLFDEATADRLRVRAGADPDAAAMLAALDRVRQDLAQLGAEPADPVPAAVTARVTAALRQSAARHTVTGPLTPKNAHGRYAGPRRRLPLLAIGIAATVLAVVVGAAMLARPPAPTRAAGLQAQHLSSAVPLSEPQLRALLTTPPVYGPLADPQRLASCLTGLGYPGMGAPMGAQPVQMRGAPALVMLVPATTDGDMIAVVVNAGCDDHGSGVLAESTLTHPPSPPRK